jgi:hypothetical protein
MIIVIAIAIGISIILVLFVVFILAFIARIEDGAEYDRTQKTQKEGGT